jgi:hypothetical protein
MRTTVAWTIAAPEPVRTYSTASRMARNEAKTSSPSQWMILRFLKPEKLSEAMGFAVWSCLGTEMP